MRFSGERNGKKKGLLPLSKAQINRKNSLQQDRSGREGTTPERRVGKKVAGIQSPTAEREKKKRCLIFREERKKKGSTPVERKKEDSATEPEKGT